MTKFYRIKDLGRGLDGLTIEGEWSNFDVDCRLNVSCIYDSNFVMGDRVVKSQLTPDSLFIDVSCLEETTDPDMHFTAESPFGAFISEQSFLADHLNVCYSFFNNALSITIFEAGVGFGLRTYYSQNFFIRRNEAKELIDSVLDLAIDPEDLIFKLEELKLEETT